MKSRITIRFAVLALAVASVFWIQDVASACPNCKDAFAENGGGGDLVRGYGWSIIFMLSMPFLILAGLGTYFWILVRSAGPQTFLLAGEAVVTTLHSPEPADTGLIKELVAAEREHHEHESDCCLVTGEEIKGGPDRHNQRQLN